MRGLSDWWDRVAAGVDDETHEAMLYAEFGGMCEGLADLADVTGRDRCAAPARRFLDRPLRGPLREHRDVLDGMPADTQIAKAVGHQRLGEVAGDSRPRPCGGVWASGAPAAGRWSGRQPTCGLASGMRGQPRGRAAAECGPPR
ncbi:hypothetical protein GCM10018790_51760 [Kitasatospora xanthocidica]|uniref:beta-L-arabinofuranosidase domain-containing protein n=1 Tax=Kitasatospora xanthocidica TaxID=83382 RepID=UPI0019C4B3F8|nr:beta-L-arabinofuranosidase domain-containing protein [Kitasatospora xanthocidica]GHF67450.1 hypothetical protein GCM10018790_51760 [Kitasatospora xanthocidica]